MPESTIAEFEADGDNEMRRRFKRDARSAVRDVEVKYEERRSRSVGSLSRQFHYLQMNEGGRWRVVRPK